MRVGGNLFDLIGVRGECFQVAADRRVDLRVRLVVPLRVQGVLYRHVGLAGAAGLAAMLADPDRFRGKKVATLLFGGNIDTHLLANVLVRDLVRQGRMARLHINAHDQPGALAAISAILSDGGANIVEINHSRIFTRLPAKDTLIEIVCEARDPQAIDDVVPPLELAVWILERDVVLR